MSVVNAPQIEGDPISGGLFNGNFLANRYTLEPGGNLIQIVEYLGLTGLRYPGGSLTEKLFDIGDPDSPVVYDDDGKAQDFVPLSDFLAYATANDLTATIVLPTRDNLSVRMDGNGDRFPAFDEAELRVFVRGVATGEYGDTDIVAFEIGNEYWGSGEMNAVEYGRLSSRMAEVIDDELTLVTTETGTNPGIDVIVQSGTNSGSSNLSANYAGQSAADILADLNATYGTDFGSEVVFPNGGINWRAINDELIIKQFDEDEAQAVDGVVTHLYSREAVQPGQRDFGLNQIEKSWEAAFEGIDIHVTEWNQSASDPRFDRETDYGLKQAQEVLNIFETMVESGVDQAHIWPLIQNTRNALSPDSADGGVTPSGALFAMMSEGLPGKQMLDFAVDDDSVTEFQGKTADLHGFYGDGELVFYVASTSDTIETVTFDLDMMVEGGGTPTARTIGVEDATRPGASDARATIERLAEDDFYDDGQIVATLAPGEIMEVRLVKFIPTDEFEQTMIAIDGSEPEAGPFAPDASGALSGGTDDVLNFPDDGYHSAPPAIAEPSQDDDAPGNEPVAADEAADAGSGPLDGMGWLLALLPFLGMAGLAG